MTQDADTVRYRYTTNPRGTVHLIQLVDNMPIRPKTLCGLQTTYQWLEKGDTSLGLEASCAKCRRKADGPQHNDGGET